MQIKLQSWDLRATGNDGIIHEAFASVRKERLFLYPLRFSYRGMQIKSTKDRLTGEKAYSYIWELERRNYLTKWLKLEAYISNLVEKKEMGEKGRTKRFL